MTNTIINYVQMSKGLFSILLCCFIFSACIEKKDTLAEQPKVELLLPMPCDTLIFGSSFLFTIKVTDNSGLGNVSMDLHHNFGHHNHGNHKACIMDAPKAAVHPYSNSWIFALPKNKKECVFDTLINLPYQKNDSTFYDSGDYHFHVYVTDNEGYQVFTTLDVKVLK